MIKDKGDNRQSFHLVDKASYLISSPIFSDSICMNSVLPSDQTQHPKSVVSLRSLSFYLQSRVMLSNLSWSLGMGECAAVVGPNGAGKTTLLRTLCGLYRNYQGSVCILGREVKEERIESLARMVGLVPQRMEFLPGFTVSEFIELSGPRVFSSRVVSTKTNKSEGEDLDLPKYEQIASLVGDLGNRLLPELSGGELQRVIIAGAVAQGVKLLLLDEPTSNLDPSGRAQVERVLKSCREELGVSYILVTHDISLALRCCSRAVIMAAGEIVWDGATNDVGLLNSLESAYQCGFVSLQHQSLERPVVVPV